MPSRRNIIALAALIPLIAIVTLLRDDPSTPVALSSPQVAPVPPTNPTNRAAASLGITDIRALERFNAKRDAKAFAHSYNISVRLGVEKLATVTSPSQALTMLVAGVRGEGDLVHSFRDLNAQEIQAAAALVTYRDGTMHPLPEAEFTALEKELKARALSCKYGACSDCIADVRTNRLQQAQKETASLR